LNTKVEGGVEVWEGGRRLKTMENDVYFVAIKFVWVLRQNNHQRSCQNIDVNDVNRNVHKGYHFEAWDFKA
jgi:hypothetical protein